MRRSSRRPRREEAAYSQAATASGPAAAAAPAAAAPEGSFLERFASFSSFDFFAFFSFFSFFGEPSPSLRFSPIAPATRARRALAGEREESCRKHDDPRAGRET